MVPTPEPVPSQVAPVKKVESAPVAKAVAPSNVTAATFKSGWQDILDALAKQSRSAWAVAFTTKVLDYQDEVLTLLFQSQKDVDAFKNSQGAAEVLRQVIRDTFGVQVKYKAKVAEQPVVAPKAPVIEPQDSDEFVSEEEREDEVTEVMPAVVVETEKSGEFMLREMLGAKPLKDEQ
jgi:DNA polymerase-3 subunit gamma/tau